MSFPTRRTFLQTVLAVLAPLFLPRRSSFWFLHAETGESWQTDDPVGWALTNARQPILERAQNRLAMLDASQPQRVIRLVVRRCKLNLIQLRSEQVVVHHWGRMGLADLKPFFKQHGMAKNGIEVVLLDRKRERRTLLIETCSGVDLASDKSVQAGLLGVARSRVGSYRRLMGHWKRKVSRLRMGRSLGRKPFGGNPDEITAGVRLVALYRVLPKDQWRRIGDRTVKRRSFGEIAEILNRERQPTRTGKPWQPGTVRGILKRLKKL